jgi:hypothetical protein
MWRGWNFGAIVGYRWRVKRFDPVARTALITSFRTRVGLEILR